MGRSFAGVVGIAGVLLAVACGGGTDSPTSPSSSSAGGFTAGATGSGITTYSYTTDIRPILTSDCVRCHNASQRDGGYDFSTYTGVLRAVTPGSARSPLVRQTQPGGGMYRELTGDRTSKAGIIYDWVVNSGGAQ